MKILIVDDEPDVRRALRLALSGLGSIVEASGGVDGLHLLKIEKPRIVLLDLVLPGLGGLEVLTAMRRLDPTAAFLAISGRLDLDWARRALEGGARAWISKPFDPEVLRAELKRLVSPREGRDGPPWRIRRDAPFT